jgi:hypothetical protein
MGEAGSGGEDAASPPRSRRSAHVRSLSSGWVRRSSGRVRHPGKELPGVAPVTPVTA